MDVDAADSSQCLRRSSQRLTRPSSLEGASVSPTTSLDAVVTQHVAGAGLELEGSATEAKLKLVRFVGAARQRYGRPASSITTFAPGPSLSPTSAPALAHRSRVISSSYNKNSNNNRLDK